VSAIGDLPSLPGTSARLMEALTTPDVPLESISRIIERDVAIAAKVLQLVNSAFFGHPHRILTVQMAVGCLGLDILRQFVLSVEVFRTFEPRCPIPGFSLEQLDQHSRLTAAIAARLADSKQKADSHVVAALLHDAGKLVLASRLPHVFAAALEKSRALGVPLYQVEEESSGISHAEIGGYLLGLWGLPTPVVRAVARHHHPGTAPVFANGQHGHPGLDALNTVHIANALAHEVEQGATPGPHLACNPLEEEPLRALGLTPQLALWRERAAAAALELNGASA
jgi:HD-like signal output (HDOD) protein